MPPTVGLLALGVAIVGIIFLAKTALPKEYRWETVLRDLLVDNLGERK